MAAETGFTRRELGAFLRSRRERRTPGEVGLAGDVGRRRTPGLRRQEVARLAGVSVTWYTWLEQGRNIRVSHQVLASIARALRLSGAEREHLFLLAHDKLPPSLPDPAPVDPDTEQFLALLDPYPSWLFNQYFDILAWNRGAAGLLVGIDELPRERRNAVWLMFCDPRAHDLLPEWDVEARRLVSLLRAAAAEGGGDGRYAAMVCELRERSSSFRDMWDSRDVLSFTPSMRGFRSAAVGLLRLRYVRLDLVDGSRRSLIVHFPPPGTHDLPRLWRLAGIEPDQAAAPHLALQLAVAGAAAGAGVVVSRDATVEKTCCNKVDSCEGGGVATTVHPAERPQNGR